MSDQATSELSAEVLRLTAKLLAAEAKLEKVREWCSEEMTMHPGSATEVLAIIDKETP